MERLHPGNMRDAGPAACLVFVNKCRVCKQTPCNNASAQVHGQKESNKKKNKSKKHSAMSRRATSIATSNNIMLMQFTSAMIAYTSF